MGDDDDVMLCVDDPLLFTLDCECGCCNTECHSWDRCTTAAVRLSIIKDGVTEVVVVAVVPFEAVLVLVVEFLCLINAAVDC